MRSMIMLQPGLPRYASPPEYAGHDFPLYTLCTCARRFNVRATQQCPYCGQYTAKGIADNEQRKQRSIDNEREAENHQARLQEAQLRSKVRPRHEAMVVGRNARSNNALQW